MIDSVQWIRSLDIKIRKTLTKLMYTIHPIIVDMDLYIIFTMLYYITNNVNILHNVFNLITIIKIIRKLYELHK